MASGIYMWTSPSGRSYVGQSKNLVKRHNQFINMQYDKSQKKLWAAWGKYPPEEWSYVILEYCSFEMLDEREVYYIALYDTFRNGYNMTKGGCGTSCHQLSEDGLKRVRDAQIGRVHSESEKQKRGESLRKAYKDGRKKANSDTSHLHTKEVREKRAKALIGRVASEETRKKMSDAKKGKEPWNKGKPMTEEQRMKMKQIDRYKTSGANNYHAQKVVQLDMQGNFIKEWGCMMDAQRECGISNGKISMVCRGERKSAGGYKWMKAEEYYSSLGKAM